MMRSIAKISGIAITLTVIAWLWFVFTAEDWYFDLSDFIVLLVIVCGLAGLLITILWALGLTRFSTVHVRQRASIILNYLEQAVRMNLPLSRMLLAAQASEPRWFARPIHQLLTQLENGSTVADALRKSVPGTNPRTVELIRAAEGMGQLGPELTRIVCDNQDRQTRNLAEQTFLRSYPVAMLIIIVAVLSMIMLFVIPKYEQIFHDFRVPFPPITRAVVSFTYLLPAPEWFALVLGLMVLAATTQKFRHRLRWLWPTKWFTSNRDLADICHVISRALAAGVPLDSAILSASQLAIGRRLRRKLQRWSDGINAGLAPTDAANAADLPGLISGLTTTTEGFEFLSRYYAGKFSRLKIMLRAAAIPAMVFFFGIIVAILALALFLPLISLIDSVSPGSSPYSKFL